MGAAAIKAEFDPGCCSSGINLENGNTWMRTTSGSRTAVYGTVGFSTGKVAWEFRSEMDTSGDEYLCYGCGIKPKSDDAYDSSSNLWMIRGYNGRVSQQGSSGSTVAKITQGECTRAPVVRRRARVFKHASRWSPYPRRQGGAVRAGLRGGRGAPAAGRRGPGHRVQPGPHG